MPFKTNEFIVGMIAIFSINQLRRHPQIHNNNLTRDKKRRPFICYAERNGFSYWTPLTGSLKRRSRIVDGKWLLIPTGARFGRPHVIVHDGRSSFVGPVEVFAELSFKYDRYRGLRRPVLFGDGVNELKSIVIKRRGIVPSPLRMAA